MRQRLKRTINEANTNWNTNTKYETNINWNTNTYNETDINWNTDADWNTDTDDETDRNCRINIMVENSWKKHFGMKLRINIVLKEKIGNLKCET